MKESWTAPSVATLHWDGKETPTLRDKYVKEERLPILVGDSSNIKLLGAAKYPCGSGSDGRSGGLIAGKCIELLEEWGCKDKIVSMCYDTTAANTGAMTAGCVSIQNEIGRALLWCSCRHHVGEVILGGAFNALKIET